MRVWSGCVGWLGWNLHDAHLDCSRVLGRTIRAERRLLPWQGAPSTGPVTAGADLGQGRGVAVGVSCLSLCPRSHCPLWRVPLQWVLLAWEGRPHPLGQFFAGEICLFLLCYAAVWVTASASQVAGTTRAPSWLMGFYCKHFFTFWYHRWSGPLCFLP